MGFIADVALPMQHLEEFVHTAVAQAITADVADLVQPSGQALSAALDRAVVDGIEQALKGMAERYAVEVLGAERSERASRRAGFRSGRRTRRLVTPLGELEVSFVKSRAGALVPPFLANKGRFLEGVKELGRKLWVRGLSTRAIAHVAEEALGGPVSHSTAAGWVQDTYDEVLRWLNRPVSADIRYIVLDGLWVSVKRDTAR